MKKELICNSNGKITFPGGSSALEQYAQNFNVKNSFIRLNHGDVTIINKNTKDVLILHDIKKYINEEYFSFLKDLVVGILKKGSYVNVSNKAKVAKPKKTNKIEKFLVVKLASAALIGVMSATLIVNLANQANQKQAELNLQESIVSSIDEQAPDIELSVEDVDQILEAVVVEPLSQIEYSLDLQAMPNERIDTLESVESKDYDLVSINVNYDLPTSQIYTDTNTGNVVDKYYESQKAVNAFDEYYDKIEYYAKMYGLDPKFVMAIATQESGRHSDTINSGGDLGLMQIHYSVWAGKSISAFRINPDTGEFEKKVINPIKDDDIRKLDSNIELGCMILQKYLRRFNYNVLAALQGYNMGEGTIDNLINAYSRDTGKSYADIIADQNDLGWFNYRKYVTYGDSEYAEHVLRWVEENSFLFINCETGEEVRVGYQPRM